MKERVKSVAQFVADFDGSLESANKILEQIRVIRGEMRQEFVALQKEIDAVEGLADYIVARRNELVHDQSPNDDVKIHGTLVMENKQERVDAVLEAALAVVKDGIPVFGIDDIRRQLDKMRTDLRVTYVPAVIATILAADKRFKRVEPGLYEYVGREQKKTIRQGRLKK